MHEITIKVEDYDEFAERHGGNPILVGTEILFRDGAAVRPENRDLRAEPSEDERVRFSYRRAYYREAIKRCREEFEKMQSDASELVNHASRYPLQFVIPEDLVSNLDAKKAEYDQLVKEANAMLAEHDNRPEERERREQQKETNQLKQERIEHLNKVTKQLDSITL